MKRPYVAAFGPTIQGEGAAAGRVAAFVRFGGCNLSCSWCDSPYTWDADRFDLRQEITMLDVDEILARVPEAPLTIVTGGEPLLNQRKPEFHELLARLRARGSESHGETNGTIVPNAETAALVDVFMVSPTLPPAGAHKPTQDPAHARGWQRMPRPGEAPRKVVCETVEDVHRTRDLADRHSWPARHVWIMPEGTTTDVLNTRFPILADAAVALGINLSHRLHVIAWGDKRGH